MLIMLTQKVAVWPLLVPLVLSAFVDRPNRCIIPSSNGTADDSPAISQAFGQCSSNSVIVFQDGVDYYTSTPVSATNLSNVQIQMNGNIHLPRNITAIQQIVNGSSGSLYSNGKYWFSLAGSNIDYIGSSDMNNGWIYSYGQDWWDANPPNGTGIDNRPHLMQFNAQNSSLNYFKSRKPIAWGVQISGNNVSVAHAFIDAGSTGSFPFNTDGFDVTGSHIRITDSVIYNGDDAIAIQSGSHNIYFARNTIGYQTHGMSIGSLGQDQSSFANVSNVLFDNVVAINALYGARFKSWIGGQGLVKNITWSNIRLYNVTFPIFVTQTYSNQGSSQTQLGNGVVNGRVNNASVMMEDFTWSGFTGTINTYQPGDGSCVTDPCWYNVGLPNLTHTEAVIVECNTNSSCEGFQISEIQVIPQSLAPPTMVCENATAALNPSLGFICRNGTFTLDEAT